MLAERSSSSSTRAALPNPQLTRRELLALSALAWSLPPAQAQEAAVPALPPLNRFPRMMQESQSLQGAASLARAAARQAALTTRAEAEAYVETIRALIRESFGPFPERTPLNPRVMRTIERDAYVIENVIFESRPEFLITANLYLPKGKPGPRPAVVGSCGHSNNGKAAEAYQSFAQGLARQGYVVLIFDPIGQGERLQYPDRSGARSTVGVGVGEHLVAGNQQVLVGEFFGAWRAWDGIRALDYLLTRPEVDPDRVGITGNSGGGTLTMWLTGLDPRWAMSAPSCAVTSFQRNFDNELPADAEQCPPLVWKLGLEHADFLAALAPRPVIILAAEQDFFDARGSTETYERLKALWKLFDAEDKLQLFIGPNEHGYTQPNREAMYGFFNSQTERPGSQEPSLTLEEDATLQCTPQGQVQPLGSRSVFEWTRQLSRELAMARGTLDAQTVHQRVADLVGTFPATPPDFNILRGVGNRRYPRPAFTTYAVRTEPGIFAVVTRLSDKGRVSRPPRGTGRVILAVSHQSADGELRDDPFLKELMDQEPESEFYAMDVRGIGESRPDTCGANQFLLPYGSDYFYAAHSNMLGRSYPVQRAFDVLRVLQWLKGFGRTEIHLAARGWGAIPATLAAILDQSVVQATFKNALVSWSSVAESEQYRWPLSSFIPGVLKRFDLPDCYAALRPRGLRLVEPWGPLAAAE